MKITEQELTGEDLIQIGDVVFDFLIKSAEYTRQLKSVIPVADDDPQSASVPIPEISSLITSEPASIPNASSSNELPLSLTPGLQAAPSGAPNQGRIPGMTGVTGIAGMGNQQSKSLFARLPKRQKILVAIIGLMIIWWSMEEGETPKVGRKPQSKPSPVSIDKNALRTFERLKPEEQKFVDLKLTLAHQYFRNGEFDKAILELGQLFSMVSDYKDALELKRYVEEGKRRQLAIEEEKKRKEEEARIKARVAELMEEIREFMNRKEYAKASEQFAKVLEIDPDNTEIDTWRKQISEWEESEKIKEIQRQTREQINKHAWGIYSEAKANFKAGKYRKAVQSLVQLGEIGATDPKLNGARIALLKRAQAAIAAVRDPLLQEARQMEEAGELASAYQLYRKATLADPDHPAGHQGMKRLKSVLHDRAKAIYTEAVLAESYSDFDTAQRKFKECLTVAPFDDVYHERAERKLARYLKKGDLQ